MLPAWTSTKRTTCNFAQCTIMLPPFLFATTFWDLPLGNSYRMSASTVTYKIVKSKYCTFLRSLPALATNPSSHLSMNGLKDFVVCARDGLCGGCIRIRPGAGRGLGFAAEYAGEEDCWDAWPGNEPAAPPIPQVIHVTTRDDADDGILLGLDFVDSSVGLPSDLFLTEQQQSQMMGYSFRRSCGGLVNGATTGRQLMSSASSLSASTDTDHAQIFHAWTGSACTAAGAAASAAVAPKVITTMAYVLPLRTEHANGQVGAAPAPAAVSDVDGSSYSSRDCERCWLARSVKSSLLLSHPKQPTTPPTEASSVASF